jgi:ERCC4-type nuclease
MIIKIDYREKSLISNIRRLRDTYNYDKIGICVENLPIGDVIIMNDNDEEKLIIERKTLNDLASSIKDGRYAEQSYRLNGQSLHNHNIMYLIEGDLEKWKVNAKYNKIKKETLYVTMFSLQYYKGFSVMKLNGVKETAEYIVRLTDKMGRDKKISHYDLSQNKIESYSNVVNKVKKKNITKDNIGEIMLCQVPGISSTTSKVIMEKYKTINNLIKEINENIDELKNLKINNRKISKNVIRKLELFFLYETAE